MRSMHTEWCLSTDLEFRKLAVEGIELSSKETPCSICERASAIHEGSAPLEARESRAASHVGLQLPTAGRTRAQATMSARACASGNTGGRAP